MAIAILITFGVIIVFVMAFKQNTSETTVTKKDENGNTITEHQKTIHHTAGQTAARIVIGILFLVIFICICLFNSVM